MINWVGSGLITKTITTDPLVGNMPLDESNQPKEWWPDCIRVSWQKAIVLNAVGLSNPGVEVFIRDYRLRPRPEPFMISWAPGDGDAARFRDHLREIKELPYSLQVNWSCPNVDTVHDLDNIKEVLETLRGLDKPIYLKTSVIEPIENIIDLQEWIDGVSCSNSIPWGASVDIDWVSLFGTPYSPLAKYGGGGLSGRPLLPLVAKWIETLRSANFTKTIIGGGGVLDCIGAQILRLAGADAIELGSITILRPWRIKTIIDAKC